MKCLQELTSNLSKAAPLEVWDPKEELRRYKLKLFNLYIEELCIKHGWEYTPSAPVQASLNLQSPNEANTHRTESNSVQQESEARDLDTSVGDGVETRGDDDGEDSK